jgi:TonB-linked SusC/RagA family outer membrane protein
MIERVQEGPRAFFRKTCGIILTLFICSMTWVMAQESRTITGTVTSESTGETLPGANILIQGTNQGTVTDVDGEFSITIPTASNVLVVSSIGYETQVVTVGNRTSLEIRMEEDLQALEEIVVIGYGEVRRRDLTGSVSSLSERDIVEMPTFNVMEAIKGRAAGVDVIQTSGEAGSGVDIRIRGNRSIDGGNSPLYIIDGFQGGSFSDLNPQDIESIEILKDASATAIYGSQGSNGVVIITTKSGQAGPTTVSYNAFYGVNGLTQFPQMRLRDDYINLRREAFRTDGLWSSPEDDAFIFANDGEWGLVQNDQWVDWTDLLMRDGSEQSHTLSVRGGNERTKTFFSGGYYNQEGMMRGDQFSRYNGRYNVSHKLSNWAEVGMLGQLTFSNRDRRNSTLSNAVTMSPLGMPYDEDGLLNYNPNPNTSFVSPLADERDPYAYQRNETRTNILFNAFLELTPIEGLKFRSNFSTEHTNFRHGIFQGAESYASRDNGNVISQVTQNYNRFYNFDNILTYSKEVEDHRFTITGVSNYIRTDVDNLFAFGMNQALPTQLFHNLGATDTDGRIIDSEFTRSNMISFAGRLDYAFKDRYLLTLTSRWDGASQLAPGNKWDYFPSIAAAWIISDEEFMQGIEPLSFLKVRGSYGIAGNAAVPPYGTQSLIEPRTNMNFGAGNPATFYTLRTLAGNENLGWEKTGSYNFAIDAEFFNGRIRASADIYRQHTWDLLYQISLPNSTGVQNMYANVGETENRGVEVQINTQNVQRSNFTWNSTLTFTRNREQILDLIDGEDIIIDESNSLLMGRPINSFYSYRQLGIWQISEADEAAQLTFDGRPFQPGDIKVEDVNGDGVITPENDRQFLGSEVPDFILGLQNTFVLGSFDLSAFVFARWGQMISADVLGRYNPSGEGNGPAFMDYWTPENPSNDYPRPRRGASLTNYAGYQSLRFVDGSFVKLQTVSLGYTMPQHITERLKLQNLRLYVTGNNLAAWSKERRLAEYDPESAGQENFPMNRQIVVGINVDF